MHQKHVNIPLGNCFISEKKIKT